MNREEKIEKTYQYIPVHLSDIEGGISIKELQRNVVGRVIDALEEKPAPQFRDNEIIKVSGYEHYLRYSQLVDKNDARKLSTAELAATCAPPDAKFWAVDDCNTMRFYKDTPRKSAFGWAGVYCEDSNTCVYHVYCHVDDWTTAKGEL